ncbi:MAG: ROK family protein [Candidatus Sungbacteria bacterium]|nr:ROK family protein [Candidatus Sungbacteria bacterium]
MRIKYYLGIDIGASKVGAVILSGHKKERVKYWEASTAKNLAGWKKDMERLIIRSRGNAKGSISGISVGVAGVVDVKKGKVLKSPNIPFLNGFNVAKFFKKFASRVRVDNDVRCFLRAEVAWGAAKNHKDVVALAVGTGVGGAVMTNGKIIYGHGGSAGEFGHMVVEKGKTLEELGNAKACKSSSYWNQVLGLGVANVINALNPEMVILGGGIVFSKYFHLGEVRRVARSKIISPKAKHTPIVKGKLGPAGQAIGAALLLVSK